MTDVIESPSRMHAWRGEPGSYCLLIETTTHLMLNVGRLGYHAFPPGRYAYLGSALGPGGIAARLNRHLRPDKAMHWHIDYLTAAAPIVGVAVAYRTDRLECAWSQAFQRCADVGAPVRGFGSSDCRSGCPAHLWRLPDYIMSPFIEDILSQCPIHTI